MARPLLCVRWMLAVLVLAGTAPTEVSALTVGTTDACKPPAKSWCVARCPAIPSLCCKLACSAADTPKNRAVRIKNEGFRNRATPPPRHVRQVAPLQRN